MFISGSHSLTKTPGSGPGSPVTGPGLRHNIVMLLTRGAQWPHTESTGVTCNRYNTPHAADERSKTRHCQVTVDSSLSSHNIQWTAVQTVLNLIFSAKWDHDFDN